MILASKGLKESTTPKLLQTFDPKVKYLVHYRNLKKYLELGMELVKIHCVLRFEQSTWLKSYIEKNTEQRKKAKNDFEKDFFKLLNNSCFGRTPFSNHALVSGIVGAFWR
jgi:hypothetical protein